MRTLIALLLLMSSAAVASEPGKGLAPSVILTSPCAYEIQTFVDIARDQYGVEMEPNENYTEGVFFTTDDSVQHSPDRIVILEGDDYKIVLLKFYESDTGYSKWCMISAFRPYTKQEMKISPSIRHKLTKGAKGGSPS